MNPREAKRRVAGKKVSDTKRRSETDGVKTGEIFERLQAVISKRLLSEGEISPGIRTVVVMKNGMLQRFPVRLLSETKGMIPGLNSNNLRDERGDIKDFQRPRGPAAPFEAC